MGGLDLLGGLRHRWGGDTVCKKGGGHIERGRMARSGERSLSGKGGAGLGLLKAWPISGFQEGLYEMR